MVKKMRAGAKAGGGPVTRAPEREGVAVAGDRSAAQSRRGCRRRPPPAGGPVVVATAHLPAFLAAGRRERPSQAPCRKAARDEGEAER